MGRMDRQYAFAAQIRTACVSLVQLAQKIEGHDVTDAEIEEWARADAEKLIGDVNEFSEKMR